MASHSRSSIGGLRYLAGSSHHSKLAPVAAGAGGGAGGGGVATDCTIRAWAGCSVETSPFLDEWNNWNQSHVELPNTWTWWEGREASLWTNYEILRHQGLQGGWQTQLLQPVRPRAPPPWQSSLPPPTWECSTVGTFGISEVVKIFRTKIADIIIHLKG